MQDHAQTRRLAEFGVVFLMFSIGLEFSLNKLRIMRAWFEDVARRRSTELFVLNVLLVILAMAFLTGLAGPSLALGAFLAGMLISETEYRYQVEDEIKPFRDVLLEAPEQLAAAEIRLLLG